MFIDTSAFVAILSDEIDGTQFSQTIQNAERRYTSGVVRLETAMVLTRKISAPTRECLSLLNFFIHSTQISVLDITHEISDLAIETFAKFGKGQGHGAGLNLSDCMTYAVAKYHRLPILFKGNDFGKTDATIAALPKF